MAASAHAVYAVAGNALYRSPLGSSAWVRVNARTRLGPMTGSTLAAWANSVWFASSTYLWTTTDGVHWARYALHSPSTAYGVPYGLAGIAAASSRDVAFLWNCAQGMYHTVMKVQISFNGGRTQEQAPSSPPFEGDVAAFAVTPGRLGVISIGVVTPRVDNIYRSANLGEDLDHLRDPRHRWRHHAELARVHEPGGGLPRGRGPGIRHAEPPDANRRCGPDLACGQVLS